VTNGEIEDYIKVNSDRAKDLRDWKLLFDTFCGDKSKADIALARLLPAANIDYSTARKYAASVQGLLPTEAEWEYAARSRGQNNWFSWGPDPAPIDQPKANLENPRNFGKLAKPQAVFAFPEDATGQHVIGMTGNVQEFCVDVYKSYAQLNPAKLTSKNPYVDRRDEAPPKAEDKVVVKGGSFEKKQSQAKAFLRTAVVKSLSISGDIGFRVVIECPPEDGEVPWPRRGSSLFSDTN
jgi:serine/threonine-protein kinase